MVVVCIRLFTSGRESHGWLFTGVKESLADLSDSSYAEIAMPGRESLVVWLITGSDGSSSWLFNPGQESHMVWLVTG